MADRRTPTELEARMLLRDVARRMEDERVVSDYCERVRPQFGPRGLVALTALVGLGLAGFSLLEKHAAEPRWTWMLLVALAVGMVSQAVEIRRLTKVVTALARMSGRARDAEPLPRAPSPPAPTAG